MRRIALPFLAALALAAGPALSQTAAEQTPSSPPRGIAPHKPRAHTGVAPVDHGPNTPEANRAYQGGGEVLQGAPGGPPPTPQATPPGQAPQGAAPPAR